jgi:HEAT repeats
LFSCCRLVFFDDRRCALKRAVSAMILLTASVFVGCENAPPPVIDPTKTPWLDPKTQIESLKDPNFKVRGLAAFNLGNMEERAAGAIPELERLAKNDPNAKVRENAAAALKKIRAAAGDNDK